MPVILNPLGPGECEFFRNAEIVERDGKIVDYGEVEGGNCDGLIVPSFCDLHVHWVQNRVRGMFSEQLLPWLKEYIWPEEGKFADNAYVDHMVKLFYADLAANGTKHAMIYSSVHKYAAEAAIAAGKGRGNFVAGNVLMDQNSPEYLQRSTDDQVELVTELASEYGESYAVTPRFGPTCTFDLMSAVSEIAREHRCFIQTHLSENRDEIEWVRKLFPDYANYTEVYEAAGLLGPKSVMGHCIHLSDSEFEVLKRTGTAIAHCPSSNVALGSGTMPVKQVFEHGIPFALGSDVGAGPELSMLDVMRSYVEVHEGDVTAVDALYRATLAGAEIMGIADRTGNFGLEKDADFFLIEGDFSEYRDAETLLRTIL